MSLLDGSVRDFLATIAEPAPTATGGAVAAVTTAAAAGLCAMVAGIRGADGARDRAERARAAATELVDADGRAYAAVMRAKRMPADAPDRAATLRAALRSASEPPMRLCALAADVGALAAELSGRCPGALRGDAVTASGLAAAAARAAAGLVRVNLSAAGEGPGACREAEELVRAAECHAATARAHLPA